MISKKIRFLSTILALILFLCGCEHKPQTNVATSDDYIASVNEVPEFDGHTPFVIIRGNEPDFKASDLVTYSYEKYSDLDILGRCSVATACVGIDIMPTEERESIGQVKPSGWQTVKYDIIDGKYLYNRCHLIGFQLTGENANKGNLITGTRFLNVEGMLPFENMIADYLKETSNHVLYRVTPVFDGVNLVARGVQLEAKSVEDNGEGICFNVYVYNSQPGIFINYLNGESSLLEGNSENIEMFAEYVLNTNTKKFHLPACKNAADIKETNKEISFDSREYLISKGYTSCKACNS